MTTDESGLMRAGGVVVLTGPALRSAAEAALLAVRQRRRFGIPADSYEALARELIAAVSASGQGDVPPSAISDSDVVKQKPTMPISELAERLNCSTRQARRLAPKLGGQRVAGRWLVDEIAVREHQAGAA